MIIHIILFITTFLTTSIAGAMWANKDFTDISNLSFGLTYAILLMLFLAAHEFGHYIASRIHKVEASLPFFIPFPPIPMMPSFGTWGAVIKTRSPILTKKALFDIGVSGPIAGFIISSIFLIYGLETLPAKDFIYQIHPEYLTNPGGAISMKGLHFGDMGYYWILSKLFANPNGWLPPMNEIYHYPFLNVGWFGLFVTCLNLLPMGQLDGGHTLYAMFGESQGKIAKYFFWILIILGIGSVLSITYDLLEYDSPNKVYIFFQDLLLPTLTWIKVNIPFIFQCWNGWILWAILGRFFFKLKHPVVHDQLPLSSGRMLIGWAAILIFILSFPFNGLFFVE